MQRTTVYLDEETVLAIRQLAAVEQRSQAEVIRAALRNYLAQTGQRTRPMPVGVGRHRSGRSDVSTDAEALLRSAARRRRR